MGHLPDDITTIYPPANGSSTENKTKKPIYILDGQPYSKHELMNLINCSLTFLVGAIMLLMGSVFKLDLSNTVFIVFTVCT